MSNRSWFFAAGGQQQGPYPEAQFRDLIARGTVRTETLVWTEGMAGWQQAGEIPGLVAGGTVPPAMPHAGGAVVSGEAAGGPLSIEPALWPFLGRTILFVIGMVLVIPAPWVAVSFYRWVASRINVPGRPNFGFTGQVGDIWYAFVLLALCSYAGATDYVSLRLILIPVEAFLSWMIIKWIATNLSSNGQHLPITFEGSAIGYIGWYVLMFLSFITIIGWAWVYAAQVRWLCRNIQGTRRQIIFHGTGLEYLWRVIVVALASSFIIPIPWMVRWLIRWQLSQTELAPRTG